MTTSPFLASLRRITGGRGPDIDRDWFYAMLPNGTPEGDRRSVHARVEVLRRRGEATEGSMIFCWMIFVTAGSVFFNRSGHELAAVAVMSLIAWPAAGETLRRRFLRRAVRRGRYACLPRGCGRAADEVVRVLSVLAAEADRAGQPHLVERAADARRQALLALAAWAPAQDAAVRIEADVARLSPHDPDLLAHRNKARRLRDAADALRAPVDIITQDAEQTTRELTALRAALRASQRLALDTTPEPTPAVPWTGTNPLGGQADAVAVARRQLRA